MSRLSAWKRTCGFRIGLRDVRLEPLRYDRSEGYRTAKITFPFKVLADFFDARCGLVEPRGIEPLTSSLRTTRSPN